MKRYNLADFTRGWIIGNFEPSIIKSKEFEFMVRNYNKGDREEKHVHKIADEVTVIINGEFIMNNKNYTKGDIIHLSPGDITDFRCISSGTTAVIKTPSVIGDKYIIKK
jgi:mannose-6-phosphate isomerase-like protein (cupin superfamily)